MKSIRSDMSGFTLVEIIVTLTVAALLSVMLVQFMGNSILRSNEPFLSMQAGMAVQSVIENINADYKRLLLTDDSPLDALKTRVDSLFYGTYTVTASDYILFDSNQIEAPCDPNHTVCNLLKVTISLGDHSLTTLFAR